MARPSLAAEYDVAIVGAGLAGLVAARAVLGAGKSAVVIEARERIGGRTFTDTTGFAVDLGGQWLEAGSPLIQELGLKAAPAGAAAAILSKGKELSKQDYVRYAKLQQAYVAKIDEIHSKLPGVDPLGLLNTPDALAAIALAELRRRPPFAMDLAVPEGLGSAVARWGARVPAKLGAPLVRIDSTGRLIELVTTSGSLLARTAIVTLPAGVLVTGSPGFAPPLKAAKREAIAALPMAHYDKVAVSFSRRVIDAPNDARIITISRTGRLIDALVRPQGREGAILFLAGDEARDLEAGGASAAGAWGLSALTEIFGKELRTAYTGVRYSHWSDDPFARGAWTVPKLGATNARATLAEPHHERLFFAGEGSEDGNRLTAAYASGVRAARQALAAIK